jgi:1-acyl-sn-glycerol-3-phosphate acyltransferase
MDAFILAAAVPVRHFSLAKSILFSIPFFSWHLAAYGGVAINRNDKEQAIRALGAAASSARGGDCVAVAPEGTRSTSGQLLSFKKGPFHLWQSLKSAPVVPVVVYGAFELYPPGKQMSLPGKVIMEFLEPIVFSGDSSTSESRDLMSRRVRRSMLNALMKSPDNVGDTGYVSLRDRGVNILAIMFIFLLNALIVMFARNEIIRRGLSVFAIAAKLSVLCLTLTVILFGYKVYVQPRLADRKRRSKSD